MLRIYIDNKEVGVDDFNKSLSNNSGNSFIETIKVLKQGFEIDIPNQYRIVYDELAKAGWYIDYHLAPKTLADLMLLDYTNMTYLDYHLTDYFRKKVKTIHRKIQKLYPDRRKIIDCAFRTHKRKEYELSIPIFLIQVDGICFDLIQKDFFSVSNPKREKNKELPKHWVLEQQFNNFQNSVLEPLYKNEYPSVRIDRKDLYPFALNRNAILHGRDISYATERNSLKAISLLNYISIIVANIKYERCTPS